MIAKPTSERKVRRGRPAMAPDVQERIIQMYNDDYPTSEIAKEINVSRATIFRIVRENREH